MTGVQTCALPICFPVTISHSVSHLANFRDLSWRSGLFPSHDTPEGMTLRDYFAAMALQGWLASFSEEMEPHPRKTAEFCYVIADAMMDARDE